MFWTNTLLIIVILLLAGAVERLDKMLKLMRQSVGEGGLPRKED